MSLQSYIYSAQKCVVERGKQMGPPVVIFVTKKPTIFCNGRAERGLAVCQNKIVSTLKLELAKM